MQSHLYCNLPILLCNYFLNLVNDGPPPLLLFGGKDNLAVIRDGMVMVRSTFPD